MDIINLFVYGLYFTLRFQPYQKIVNFKILKILEDILSPENPILHIKANLVRPLRHLEGLGVPYLY